MPLDFCLKAGSQFVVIGDRDVMILKNISPPSLDEFDDLIADARKKAACRSCQLRSKCLRNPNTEYRQVHVFYGDHAGRITDAMKKKIDRNPGRAKAVLRKYDYNGLDMSLLEILK